MIKIAFLAVTLCCIVQQYFVQADCYEAWSRCSGWSSGGTGILWKTCADRCRKCQGRAGGSCQHGNFGCGAKEQCVCSGGNVPKSDSWRDKLTCKLGL